MPWRRYRTMHRTVARHRNSELDPLAVAQHDELELLARLI
jgi:hypothetical protein